MALTPIHMRPGLVFAIVGMFSIGSVQSVEGAGLRKIWDVDLKKWYSDESGERDRQTPFSGLVFSPDGEQIAAIVRSRFVSGRQVGGVWIIRANAPEAAARHFEAAITLGPDNPNKDFSWSPSGGAISAGGTVIRLADGASCNVGEFGGFLADDDILVNTSPRGSISGPSHFTIFSAACKAKVEWTSPDRWYLMDVSPERGRLLVDLPEKGSRPEATLVVEAEDGRIIREWRGEGRPVGRFGNSGRSICGAQRKTPQSRLALACWDTDSGGVTAVTGEGLGIPFAMSMHTPRIVAAEYVYSRGRVPDRDRNALKELVVWDFLRGTRVVSWVPGTQAYEDSDYADGRPPRHVDEIDKFAISPDGQYLVEGGEWCSSSVQD